jgi:catechol 2,3-dioxygenase-like lactoylglutathione lyase family enzyme
MALRLLQSRQTCHDEGDRVFVDSELDFRPQPREHKRVTGTLVSISPFFIVKDLQASIAFYRDSLGFQVDFQGPPDAVYYAGVRRDGVGIMLKTISPDVLPCPNHTRHPWARWDAYIYTLDPDTLFEEFRQRSVPFVKELSFIDEGLWGFEITDADGYVIAFFRLRND